jgi:hypothetical protein
MGHAQAMTGKTSPQAKGCMIAIKLPTLLLRAAFAAASAFALTMALLPKPPKVPIDAFGDKFEHMLAFATLALLARLAFPRASAWRLLERLSFFGALIEVFQAIPALHRDCDWHDWVADTIAIAAMLALLGLWQAGARWWPRIEGVAARAGFGSLVLRAHAGR